MAPASTTEPTPSRTHSISGLKTRVLKLTFLALKMMVKSGLQFILKFTELLQRYLLTSPNGQIFWHWAAVTLKGLGEFQNKILDILEIYFKNVDFKTRDFSPLIK